ncbi:MAG: bestrophin family protein [Acidocella sp.]|nr:bestrophin family protein [Acidocella sp.]
MNNTFSDFTRTYEPNPFTGQDSPGPRPRCNGHAMIVRPRPSTLDLLIAMRGSVVPVIAPRLLVILTVSCLVVWLRHFAPGYFAGISPAPFTLLGIAVPIFLGFRNNACYDRWWEGRKQWGALVAESRNLLRDITTLLPEDTAQRRRCAHRVVAFAHALRNQLRDSGDGQSRDWLPAGGWARLSARRNRPGAILQDQAAEFTTLLRAGALSDILYHMLSERLTAMTGIQAACERLRASPMPFAYSLLLHRTVWLFCLLLPFGIVGSLGLATPILTTVLAYAFLGLDALGEDLEEPFSLSQNGLPLDALVRNIEIAAAEVLDEPPPAPLTPVHFILL